ncbi:MAG: EAL domain-containing protein [Oscillibacter sp.]
MFFRKPSDHVPHVTIFHTILRSMLWILFIEIALLVGILYLCRINTNLEQNAVDILQIQTENRQNYLQGQMLDAQDLSSLAGKINAVTQAMLDDGEISLDTLDSGSDAASPLLLSIGDSLISSMRHRPVTGIFVVLNTHDLDTRKKGEPLPCLYLRDLDPNSSPSQRNSDLMLVRAPAQVVQSLYIATDTSWTPSINYGANGSSGFLYPVFQAAYHGNGELDAADYGHWTSSPYTLSGDDHSAIAYTIPLILDDGTVYGVLGVEILESYLQALLPGTELQNDSSGTYLLGVASNSAIGKDDLTVSVISASPLQMRRSNPMTRRCCSSRQSAEATRVTPLGLCHAAVAPLTLYNRNAPFSNEQMLLIGSVPVSALYAFSGYVLRFLIIAVLVVLTAGLFSSLVLARKLSRPISRLSDEVAHARESRSSIPMLSATGIIELDRFSSAFTQLGREVLDTSTKFLRIMDMASVELGGYELRSAPDSIYVTDNFFDLLGMPGVDADDLTAQSFRELLQRFERSCPHSPAPDGAMLYHIRLPSGKERYLRIETTHEDGTQVGLAEDATANTLEKLRIEHECDYDTLTDLYNRRAFHRICAEFFCSPEKLGHAALLMFDLDNLKQINDTFGHDWGDEYIRRTGECFAKNAPARTVCARISSDEFSAFFYGYNDQDTLRADIRALKAALEHSVVQLPSGRELRVSVSGGIAWYPESSTNLITLRKYADFAMYQVKLSRKGELLEFDPEVYRTSLQERRCHEEFRRLINEELISYHFQPIIDAKDGSVFAYEALMRVDLPTLHSPADVLRLAREENCLHEVERITFFCASSAYQALENAGKVVPSALLFINSIASQYLTPDELSEYSARYASILPRIVIEITEEECLDPKALRIKQTIRGSSGAFALDDYGSGYSNERSLLELSPNYIKIDLSIIRSIDTDANKRQIVSNTVSYAHQRGMKVVAEGLETADEVRTVLSLGVDLLQGFFLAMPQVEPGGASEESLAVIAEMHSQSDESQISIFGGDKQ